MSILFYLAFLSKLLNHNENLTMKIRFLETENTGKVIISIKSKMENDFVFSTPSFYPIAFISIFDNEGKIYPATKIRSSVILKKEVFKLASHQEKVFVYRSLKSLYPFVDYKKVSKIVAVWYYNAYKESLSYISDTLIIKH